MPIVPGRIRQARAERGLSLAELAGAEVSRAFIHQLEQGLARPSLQVLEMIAQRTGKSVGFFLSGEIPAAGVESDLPSDLVALSKRLERLLGSMDVTESNREGTRLVINSLRHGARMVAAMMREREQTGARD